MLVINPGTGHFEGSLKEAKANMKVFIEDLYVKYGFEKGSLCFRRVKYDDGDGWFYFELCSKTKWLNLFTTRINKYYLIAIPGLPLEQVRCLNAGQTTSGKRLYVNGDSWYWKFALDVTSKRRNK